jgi:hypothetical protein
VVEREFACCSIIAFALPYDTSGATPFNVGMFRNFALKTIGEFLGSSRTGMTAKRFLQIYSNMSNHVGNSEMTCKEAKSDYTVRALKMLREKHHKKKLLDSYQVHGKGDIKGDDLRCSQMAFLRLELNGDTGKSRIR